MSQDSVEDLLNDEDDLEEDYNLDNDEEEKLLQDDSTDICENETSENELDESEDVLRLEPEDEFEEDEVEEKRVSNTGERMKSDKFTNERPPISPVQFRDDENVNENNKNFKRNNFQGNRTRGRFNKQQKWKTRNKTVHINPHFKGDVQINGNARLKWDPPQNQKQTGNYGRNFGNFNRPPPPIKVWQNPQQNVISQRSFSPQRYMNAPGRVHEVQVVQHYPQPQMTQVVSSGQVLTMPYNQPTQFFQNREVFANQAPMTVGFFQPPPQPQPLMNQQCYQQQVGPTNFCNNPVYNHPPPYNPTTQCFPYNNQPLVYNTPPPPTQGDYCQTYSMHSAPPPPQPPPPSVNYCSTFENNTNSFERAVMQPRSDPGYSDTKRVVKAVFSNKQQKKRFTNKNFDAIGHHKKKRVLESSNLHEIKPTENLTASKAIEKSKDKITFKVDTNLPDGLDEEYMRKIEEQKRLREEIFRKKELKRMEKASGVASAQSTNTSPIKKLISKSETNIVKRQNIINNQKTRNQNRNLIQINQEPSDELPNIQIEVAAQNTSRIIHLKNDEEEDVGLTKGFLSNRMVLSNDHSLLHTPVVVVKNLSAGTTENKLRKLCQGIGEVQTLHLSREERQATIRFKNVASAHAFYKKYQRYMLDLSMIQVHLQTV